MKLTCPKCHGEIPLEDVSVSKDLALCRPCSQTFSFAELAQDRDLDDVDISRPPKGAWYDKRGNDFEVGATTRSAIAFFLVPFTALWSGGSMAGIYGSQIVKGHFELGNSLFGIPFLIGTMFLVPFTLMTVVGKIAVRGSGDNGCVFIGIWRIGWTRRFRLSEVSQIKSSLTKWRQNERYMPLIEIVAKTPIRFGSQMSEVRRDFFLAVLKRRVRPASQTLREI